MEGCSHGEPILDVPKHHREVGIVAIGGELSDGCTGHVKNIVLASQVEDGRRFAGTRSADEYEMLLTSERSF